MGAADVAEVFGCNSHIAPRMFWSLVHSVFHWSPCLQSALQPQEHPNLAAHRIEIAKLKKANAVLQLAAEHRQQV